LRWGEGQQQANRTVVEQRRVGERAGRDDARDRALDRALGGGRVADLLADHHRFAQLHQPRQVLLDGVEGHAAIGSAAGRLAARGQRDVEQARGLLGVLEEQLVEIAHAVEQQQVSGAAP
jgi:hypothetical protein